MYTFQMLPQVGQDQPGTVGGRLEARHTRTKRGANGVLEKNWSTEKI